METVKQILEAQGVQNPVEDMEVGERYEIPSEPTAADMDLTIEKIGEHQISVAHYYTQRGDLMRDPEIVYRIENGNWTPIEYTQDPGVYQRNEAGLRNVQEFSQTWSENLRRQGFLQAAEQTEVNQ
jgi:hypothetical protein